MAMQLRSNAGASAVSLDGVQLIPESIPGSVQPVKFESSRVFDPNRGEY